MQEKGKVLLGGRFPNQARGEAGFRNHSPRAKQKSRKASWAWTPQAWSFNRGGNSLTSASRPFPVWDLEEEAVEEEGKAEDVLLPEAGRVFEVSTEEEEAVRAGDWEQETIEPQWGNNRITS